MRTFSRTLKKMFVTMLLLHGYLSAEAVTYYSRSANGYWTDPAAWSTVTYGNATNTGTYPKRGDVVMIGDGHRMIMDMNAVCASVTVGQGTSGQLEFSNYLSFTMTIAGTLTINSGATVNYPGNSSRSHNLFISRHIVNNGTLDLYRDSDDLVNIVFNSTVNSIISGTGTFDLNRVTMSKSSSLYNLEAQVSSFENAIRQLILTTGTYIHNNSNTFYMTAGSSSASIGQNAIFRIPQGTVHFAPDGDYLYLEGALEIDGGSAIVGSTAGNQGIRYHAAGSVVPSITMSSGMLEVRGGITTMAAYPLSAFDFSMTGGTVLLNTGTSGTADIVFHVNDVAGSIFSMYNGTIVIQNPNTNPGVSTDFSICGSAGTVDVLSGTVEFGNASTSNNAVFTFMPYAGNVQPHFHVTGAPANAVTLCPAPGTTGDFRLLSLQIDPNKTFDVRSINGTGDSRTMYLTYEMDGLHALYNEGQFTARTGNVQLEGAEGQWIGGTATTVFYDFTINNPFGAVINSSMEIGNLLLMNNGIIYSSAMYPVVLNTTGSSTIGSPASYVEGPVLKQVASVAPQNITFPVGKSGAHRPVILNVQQSSLAMVTYTTEMWNSSAQALGYTIPPDLRWVSDVRFYTIQPSSTASLVSARVTLSYDVDDVVNDYLNLRVGRDDGSGNWINTGGTGTAPWTGSITSAPFTSFNSTFTLANPLVGANWLPVELVSFTGTAGENYNALRWSTASEINSDYFEVERSNDGRAFLPFARVKAAGNSSVQQLYSANDHQPGRITYYRLKMVDLDGAMEYSNVITLAGKTKSVFVAYPNPSVSGRFSLKVPEDFDPGLLSVTDLNGRNMNVRFIAVNNEFEPETTLQPGVYIIRGGGAENLHTRVVVADTE